MMNDDSEAALPHCDNAMSRAGRGAPGAQLH